MNRQYRYIVIINSFFMRRNWSSIIALYWTMAFDPIYANNCRSHFGTTTKTKSGNLGKMEELELDLAEVPETLANDRRNYGGDGIVRISSRKDDQRRCLTNMFVLNLRKLPKDPSQYRLTCEIFDMTCGRKEKLPVPQIDVLEGQDTYVMAKVEEHGACRVDYHVKGYHTVQKKATSPVSTQLQLFVRVTLKSNNSLVAVYNGQKFSQLGRRNSTNFPRKDNPWFDAEFDDRALRNKIAWKRTKVFAQLYQGDKERAFEYLNAQEPLPVVKMLTSMPVLTDDDLTRKYSSDSLPIIIPGREITVEEIYSNEFDNFDLETCSYVITTNETQTYKIDDDGDIEEEEEDPTGPRLSYIYFDDVDHEDSPCASSLERPTKRTRVCLS